MTLHNLKLEEKYITDVFNGIKTFELRKNDRNYQVGDLIHFISVKETEIEKNLFEICYILKDVEKYGLDKDYCILGIGRLY